MLPFLFFSCCLCRFSPNVIYKTKKLVPFFLNLASREREREREGALSRCIQNYSFFFFSKPRHLSSFFLLLLRRRRRHHCRSRDPPQLLRADQGRVVSRSSSLCFLWKPHGEDDDNGGAGGSGRGRRSGSGFGGGSGGSEGPRPQERGDVRPGLRGVRDDDDPISLLLPSERPVCLAGRPAARGSHEARGERGERAAAAAKDQLLLPSPSVASLASASSTSSSSSSSSSPLGRRRRRPLLVLLLLLVVGFVVPRVFFQPVLDKGPPASWMPPLERRGELKQARRVLPRAERERRGCGGGGGKGGVVLGQVSLLSSSFSASFFSCFLHGSSRDERVKRRLEQEQRPEEPRGAGAGQGRDAGAERVRQDVGRRRRRRRARGRGRKGAQRLDRRLQVGRQRLPERFLGPGQRGRRGGGLVVVVFFGRRRALSVVAEVEEDDAAVAGRSRTGRGGAVVGVKGIILRRFDESFRQRPVRQRAQAESAQHEEAPVSWRFREHELVGREGNTGSDGVE